MGTGGGLVAGGAAGIIIGYLLGSSTVKAAPASTTPGTSVYPLKTQAVRYITDAMPLTIGEREITVGASPYPWGLHLRMTRNMYITRFGDNRETDREPEREIGYTLNDVFHPIFGPETADGTNLCFQYIGDTYMEWFIGNNAYSTAGNHMADVIFRLTYATGELTYRIPTDHLAYMSAIIAAEGWTIKSGTGPSTNYANFDPITETWRWVCSYTPYSTDTPKGGLNFILCEDGRHWNCENFEPTMWPIWIVGLAMDYGEDVQNISLTFLARNPATLEIGEAGLRYTLDGGTTWDTYYSLGSLYGGNNIAFPPISAFDAYAFSQTFVTTEIVYADVEVAEVTEWDRWP